MKFTSEYWEFSAMPRMNMKITNETTIWQVAELMGPEADEIDGRIMMSLISRECIVDTEEVSEDEWLALIDEAQEIRRRESEDA